jgi:hypothetical protein
MNSSPAPTSHYHECLSGNHIGSFARLFIEMHLFYRKDVRLPVQLQRAMAAEAEAAREARAKVYVLPSQINQRGCLLIQLTR